MVENIPFFRPAKVPGCQGLRLQPSAVGSLGALTRQDNSPPTLPLGAWPRERSEVASENGAGKDSLEEEVRDLSRLVFNTLGLGAPGRGVWLIPLGYSHRE